MTKYNKSLQEDDELKRKLIMLVRGEGYNKAGAARVLGLSERSVQAFFNAETQWAEFWWEENEDIVAGYFSGFSSESIEGSEFKFDTQIKDSSGKSECARSSTGELADSIYVALSGEDEAGNGWSKDLIKLFQTPTQIKGTVITPTNHPLKICVIADTQCKPDQSLDYMKWIGKYIFDKKPDVVVHVGDNYDFPSLSSYDKGKKSFEGRRLKADIQAGNLGMESLTQEFLKDDYNPRMVFCTGNHENRFDRLADDMPELDGFVGTEMLPLAEMGWEVHPFLKPVEIGGIFFVHYLANPFTGKPYSGTALNQLKTVGRSFVVGHKQCLDIAIRPTIDGKHQIGIVNGAAYDFDEPYKGYTGNNHFRGIIMLHEVEDGFGLPMPVSLNYLKGKYGGQGI